MIPIDKKWPTAAGAVWRLQRGAEYVLAANLYPAGDFSVVAEGQGPRPLLVIPAAFQLASLAASGVYEWHGISIRGEGAGNGIGASRGITLRAEDCQIEGFTNGVVFGGDGALMRRLVIRECSTGIFGGSNGQRAPSRGRITACVIDGTRDAITLHDGDGIGVGNVIEDCDLAGGVENGVDLLEQFTDTVVQRNRIRSARSYPVIFDGARTTVQANVIEGTRAAIFSRGPDALIVGNVLGRIASDAEASLIAFAAAAGGQRVHGNSGTMARDTRRAGLAFAVGSGGISSGNVWRNESTAQPIYAGALAGWTTNDDTQAPAATTPGVWVTEGRSAYRTAGGALAGYAGRAADPGTPCDCSRPIVVGGRTFCTYAGAPGPQIVAACRCTE